MCDVRVALDTNILRGEAKLASAPMEALARFAEKGHLEILIPSVVAAEFTSKPSVKIEAMAELRKTLKKLKKTVPNNLHPVLAEFETRIEHEFDQLEASAKQRFAEWQKRTGVVIVEPAADHAAKVIKKYFDGALPFVSVKARTDFPDAFIVETILDLASDNPIFAVAEDGRVAEALKQHPDIKVFKSIKALLDSNEFDQALIESGSGIVTEYEQANVDKVVQEFLKDKARFYQPLKNDVCRLVAGKTLYYRNPDYDEKESPDEIYIDSVGDVVEWEFEGSSDYLGEGVVLVNFNARVEVSADDPSGSPWYDEEGNRDYSRMVAILGAVSLRLKHADLSQNPNRTSGSQLLGSAQISIDELDDISLLDRSY